MLEFKNVKKSYPIDKTKSVEVFNDLNLCFNDIGFTAILGPSGCGKTTMLNIIGGLDRYDAGDLFVDGVSTKHFKDSDWDTYRNRKIGTVFQNYNLIPHLTVLANVELALTLSGASMKYRKKKSIEALRMVGLENMINKKPNQLSGGQMQRVAIARAIVNEPKIILADEPTGALDSKTSVQVMDILKKLSKDRLVIIVTHNENLANTYATRIIRMLDGKIIDDNNLPQNEINEESKPKAEINSTIDLDSPDLTLVDQSFADQVNNELSKQKRTKKKSSMSFKTALNISFHNILTKKGRTTLTSVASSFGIIGVALVLSLSNGFSGYVNRAERDSLSQFPISVERSSVTETLMSHANKKEDLESYPNSNDIIVQKPANATVHLNDLNQEYIEYVQAIDKSLVSSIKYNYSLSMNAMTLDSSETPKILSTASTSLFESITGYSGYWNELSGDRAYIESQYDIIGKYPENSDELLISVDKYNRVSYNTMKALGYDISMGQSETSKKISFDEIMQKEFKIFSSDELFEKQTGEEYSGYYLKTDADFFKLNITINKLLTLSSKTDQESKEQIAKLFTELQSMFENEKTTKTLNYYTRKSDDELKELYKDTSKGKTLKIVGMLRPKSTTIVDLLSYGVYYLPQLTQEVLDLNKNTEVTNEIRNHCFISLENMSNLELTCYSTLNSLKKIEVTDYFSERLATATDTTITSITIYPKSFKEKSKILSYLDNYNKLHPDNEVVYSDLSSMLISSIGNMINIISIVLICFAAIALVTSSVMMTIIMYTSVLERTKEIGILRAIGARKKDVSRLFKAETVIIGAISGLIGIIVTYILCIPINSILNSIYPDFNIGTIPFLNPLHALVLIALSIFLTFLSGLVPARIASKKDAVICLRTE